MGRDHFFILLKKKRGYTWKPTLCTDTQLIFRKVGVVQGSLLRLRHVEKHRHSELQQQISVECITDEGVYVDCSRKEVKEILDYTAQLLLAVPGNVERYKVFSDRTGWLGEGVSLQLGDVVDLNMSWGSNRAYGKIRHKGTVEGRQGIVFGVELAQEFWGRGKSDGSVSGRQYFVCNKKSAVFVSISQLRRALDQTKFKDVPYAPRNITMYRHLTYQNNNSETLAIGERVVWVSGTGMNSGIVKWFGYLCNADIHTQKLTVGIELDLPVGSGNGHYKGQKLFYAQNGHAELVPLMDLVKEDDYERIPNAIKGVYEEHINVVPDPMDLSYEKGFSTIFTEHDCGQITSVSNSGYEEYTTISRDRYRQNTIFTENDYEPNYKIPRYEYEQSRDGYRQITDYAHGRGACDGYGQITDYAQSREGHDGYGQIAAVDGDNDEHNCIRASDEHEQNAQVSVYICEYGHNRKVYQYEHQNAPVYATGFDYMKEDSPEVYEYSQNTEVGEDKSEQNTDECNDESEMLNITLVIGDGCARNTNLVPDINNEQRTQASRDDFEQVTQKVGDEYGPHPGELGHEYDQNKTVVPDDCEHHITDPGDKCQKQPIIGGESCEHCTNDNIDECKQNTQAGAGENEANTKQGTAENQQIALEVGDTDKETIKESRDEYAQHTKLMNQRHEKQSEEPSVRDEHGQNNGLLGEEHEKSAKQLDNEQTTKSIQVEVKQSTKVTRDNEALDDYKQNSKINIDNPNTNVTESEVGQHSNETLDNPQQNTGIAEGECQKNHPAIREDSNMTTSNSSTVGQSKTCDLCSTGQLEVFCTVCMHSMCQPCKQQHDQMPEFSKHDATPLCSHHGKPVTFLCHQCFQGVCMPCMMKEHKDHSESFKPFTKGVELLWMKRKEQNFMLGEKIDTMKQDVEQELVYIGRVKEELKTERFELLENVFKIDNALADIEEKYEEWYDEMKKKLESIQGKAEALRKPITTIVEAMQFVARYSREENQIRDLFQSCEEIAAKKKNEHNTDKEHY